MAHLRSNGCSRSFGLWGLVLALLAAVPAAGGTSPWYVVGKLGQASVEAEIGPTVRGWTIDEEDTAGSLEVGYQLHRSFGLQLGYHDLGSYAGEPRPCPEGELCPLVIALYVPLEARFRGYSLAAVPRWPVGERFSLYGKLAVFVWDGDLSPLVTGETVEAPSDTELLAGFGAQYVFFRGLGVVLEYETSSLADSLSAGLSWRF